MDEAELFHLVQQCKHLKFRFRGVFAADNFPGKVRNGTFMIVNAPSVNHSGTHWTLIYRFKDNMYFADPLGLPLKLYQGISKRFRLTHVRELLVGQRIQPLSSDKCGLFCIFLAHFIFNAGSPSFVEFDDLNLIRFAIHMA